MEGWAEADMSRDEARAGDDGEMEGAAEALHPLIGEKIALETLLDDGRRRGGRIWRHVTCDRKRGLGDWGCGGGARRGGRPANKAHNLVVLRAKVGDEGGADEPGCPGDSNLHSPSIPHPPRRTPYEPRIQANDRGRQVVRR